MTSMNFIGLDIHKKTISYCVKDAAGAVLAEGTIPSTRQSLDDWIRTLHQPWTVAMEATMFTGWIYDHLLPHAAAVKVAHRSHFLHRSESPDECGKSNSVEPRALDALV
jgi:transposase